MAKKTDQSEKKRNDPVKFSKHWCIYRIPSKLRNVKDEAYTPQLISIGPFHHGNPKLADMESHKKKYYENFCQRTSRKKEELETFIREKEDDILRCYAGSIEPDIDFVKRLRKPKSIYDVRKLKEAGVKFRPNEGSERFVIKRGEDHKCNFKMACFRNMNLKLTKFWARYEVECVIRNVMALEQFLYPKKAYVCSYFLMLDQLVDTVEDVNALIESEVIVNLLGSSNAVAKLINSLCEQTMDDRSCYEDICKQLNEHYKISFCNRNISILKRVYFKDLWTGSSTIVGLFVLFFSIIGTIKSLM
ncbi:uncharacterized protein LOC18770780 [Prunus persica]|uniref:uncharacterized protein LOC18770780 n=1 Tax=Prunus persica TaxID=3760 RepID=UPI0009AB9D10|nr:uncharacterized protein LOC18770780 [Prunus persica]